MSILEEINIDVSEYSVSSIKNDGGLSNFDYPCLIENKC